LANKTLQQQHYEFKRLGESHFEFGAVVLLYPKLRLTLYNDAIDAATLQLWVGEGLSVNLLDYPGQTILENGKTYRMLLLLRFGGLQLKRIPFLPFRLAVHAPWSPSVMILIRPW
jgi:hypothetical protein